MKIKLNSFLGCVSLFITLLALLMFFVDIKFPFPTVKVIFGLPFVMPFSFSVQNIFLILLGLAPLLQLIFMLCCKNNALLSLLFPCGCISAAMALIYINYIITNTPFVNELIALAVFTLVFVLCIVFYKNASKAGLSILFFAIGAIMLGVLLYAENLNLSISSRVLASISFTYLANAFLSLCTQPKDIDFNIPIFDFAAETPDTSDICVKLEKQDLAQTLEALLDSYNKGDISKHEYEALKKETLWKV